MSYMEKTTPQKTATDNAKKWYETVKLKELAGKLNDPISSDDIFKFLTYWIAFNSLYDANFKQRKPDTDKTLSKLLSSYKDNELEDANVADNLGLYNKNGKVNTNDRFKILYYLDTIIERLTAFGYDNLVVSCDEIQNDIVLNDLKGDGKLSYREINKDKNRSKVERHKREIAMYECIKDNSLHSEKIKITYLIMTVYQVRCNLIHGSKKADYERDEKLVYESSVIMERVLRVIFSMEKNKPVYEILEDRINEFTKEKCKSCSKWGGAGLIISDKKDQTIIDFQKKNPGITYVINPNAKYVVWLINLLKPYAQIDYIEKYDYYYKIGNKANNYFDKNGEKEYSNEDIKNMLNAILKEVKKYFK